MTELQILDRNQKLFTADLQKHNKAITTEVQKSSFLVIGGAGTIGQATVKEIFKRNPQKLHVIDISENNLVELVRDLRSSLGYIDGEFRTIALDCGSSIFNQFIATQHYDYVLNLSALKHVRSEKDTYTIMRMIETNILNTEKTVIQAKEQGAKKYFAVSTDKASNPVNMMGCSKRIMELFLMEQSTQINISTARFANVAFSDGSLLHGFTQRIKKNQPIAAPNDVKRYFVTKEESGQICLFSTILGENRDVFFPKLSEELNLIKFSDIAIRFLKSIGYEPYLCKTEQEARDSVAKLKVNKQWPCYFFESNTTGEKAFEEFFTNNEKVDFKKFTDFGIVKNKYVDNTEKINNFRREIKLISDNLNSKKSKIVELFLETVPNFEHQEKGKNLDGKM